MEIGTNFSQMMKENVTIKKRREYVVIQKQLREKYKKLGQGLLYSQVIRIRFNQLMSRTFLSGNGNLNVPISSLTFQLRHIMVLMDELFVLLSLNSMKKTLQSPKSPSLFLYRCEQEICGSASEYQRLNFHLTLLSLKMTWQAPIPFTLDSQKHTNPFPSLSIHPETMSSCENKSSTLTCFCPLL